MINCGNNCIFGENVKIGKNVTFGHNCIVEDNVCVGDNSHIDNNVIVRKNTVIGDNSFIEANCILGEYLMDFCKTRTFGDYKLTIGSNALIRSGSILYTDSLIGSNFQTGHNVTIREKTKIGDNVSVGTLSDIQGNCNIGNYVRLHSNVHIGQLSQIDDFVWIFPYVVLTNDPTPPSENFVGVHVCSFAIVATGSVIMPGITIAQDALVGAGAIVTKDVKEYAVVVGNPAKEVSDVRNIKNKITGNPVYPWREYFGNYMPWEKTDFNSWYSSLTEEERERHCISNLL